MLLYEEQCVFVKEAALRAAKYPPTWLYFDHLSVLETVTTAHVIMV
jgi:hypothetical protein